MVHISPENAEFAIVSFEGPDEYSRAGGLAVRVRDLAETLAELGFHTHLFFIGDPHLPAVESNGRLTLHRWGQWISAYHPGGVYDGEWNKMQDLSWSLPPVLANDVVRAAAHNGRRTVIMGEDWQTVDTMINTAQAVAGSDLGGHCIPVWTANNVFGFDTINWTALSSAAQPMTVSRYMKHEMWRYGINPLVAPNGVAPSAIVDVPEDETRRLRAAFGSDIALFKIGRFTGDKGWHPALESVAILKDRGVRARILIRGDRSPYGQEVLSRATDFGLSVEIWGRDSRTSRNSRPESRCITKADVLNLTAFLPDSLVPPIYAAVDGVLANSGHEPFGLVGLEVMGAGGLAFVGSTGEEYATGESNAVVLDTGDPREIVVQLLRLRDDAAMAERLKQGAKETARSWIWPKVVPELLAKLEYVALARGVEMAE